MRKMRQKTNHRPKNAGGGNGQDNFNSGFDGENRHRHNPGGNRNFQQLHDKYLNLAREAMGEGDRVGAEYNFQYADHYLRVMKERQRQFNERRPENPPRDASPHNSPREINPRENGLKENQPILAEPLTQEAVPQSLDSSNAEPSPSKGKGRMNPKPRMSPTPKNEHETSSPEDLPEPKVKKLTPKAPRKTAAVKMSEELAAGSS
jgi:hypothetical protein